LDETYCAASVRWHEKFGVDIFRALKQGWKPLNPLLGAVEKLPIFQRPA